MMDVLLVWFAAALERGRTYVGGTVADGDNADGCDFCGDVEQCAQLFHVGGCGNSREACAQAFVYGCQQEQHYGAADIHVPERNGPDDLCAIVIDFVGFLVAAVVGGLAGAGNDQHGSSGNEGMKATTDVFLFTA